jgi:hypothetical protein
MQENPASPQRWLSNLLITGICTVYFGLKWQHMNLAAQPPFNSSFRPMKAGHIAWVAALINHCLEMETGLPGSKTRHRFEGQNAKGTYKDIQWSGVIGLCAGSLKCRYRIVLSRILE